MELMEKAKLNQTYEAYLRQETRKSEIKWARKKENIPLPEFKLPPKIKTPFYKILLAFRP